MWAPSLEELQEACRKRDEALAEKETAEKKLAEAEEKLRDAGASGFTPFNTPQLREKQIGLHTNLMFEIEQTDGQIVKSVVVHSELFDKGKPNWHDGRSRMYFPRLPA